MKYKIITLLIILVSIFYINEVNASLNDFPLIGKIIYLDAGHGGRDPGAQYQNTNEKDINLSIVKKLKHTLESYGATVYLTRETDTDLSQGVKNNKKRTDLQARADLINNSKSDIYISIHQNSYAFTKWRGLQVFYDKINGKNKELAQTITDTLKSDLSNVRDIKNVNDYYMYSKIKIPGILIETGFITNDEDRALLKQDSYQNKLALSIAKGIINYFNN